MSAKKGLIASKSRKKDSFTIHLIFQKEKGDLNSEGRPILLEQYKELSRYGKIPFSKLCIHAVQDAIKYHNLLSNIGDPFYSVRGELLKAITTRKERKPKRKKGSD